MKNIALCFIFCITAAWGTKSPNIVFILADDLGFNDLSYHGSDQIVTPNIDALAYSGTILHRHYVLPMCTPSRAALMTGRYPYKIGMQGFPFRAGERGGIPLNQTLLPQYLKKLGYSTHLVGKWHLGFEHSGYTPCERGFDTWLGYFNGMVGYYDLGYEQFVPQINGHFVGFDMHDCSNHRRDLEGMYITDILTEEAINIINNHDTRSPFFLEIAHDGVHTGNISAAPVGLEPPTSMNVNKTFPHIEEYERRLYAGMLNSLDKSVGAVVDALYGKGILNNTIIVFMSDNGAPTVSTPALEPNWGSNWPLRGVKFSLYDGGIRNTAVVWIPNKGKNKIYNHLVHMVDWLPTLYEAAGGNTHDFKHQIDGVSFWNNLIEELPASLPRSEAVLNIEDHYEALIFQTKYKIIKGGSPGYGNYDKHSGKERNILNPPIYDIGSIKHSEAGSSILKLHRYEHVFDDWAAIRQNVSISCNIPPESAISSGYVNESSDFLCKHYCLFNVLEDPCELHDISKYNPSIAEHGANILKFMKKHAVGYAHDGSIDLRSDPDNFQGIWTPWLNKASYSVTTHSLLNLAILKALRLLS